MSPVLHEGDCPMTNSRPEARTTCICGSTQWSTPEGLERTYIEGGGGRQVSGTVFPAEVLKQYAHTLPGGKFVPGGEFATGGEFVGSAPPVGEPFHSRLYDPPAEPAFTIDRYGSTYSITLVVYEPLPFVWVRKGRRRTRRLAGRKVVRGPELHEFLDRAVGDEPAWALYG